MRNIRRALKPGGKVYLQFFALHGRPKNDRFLYQTACQSRWKSYFRGFKPGYSEVTLSEFSTLLQSVGFIVHRIEFQRYKSMFEHPEQLQQWLTTWATHKDRVSRGKQDQFLAETVCDYLKAHQYSLNDVFPYYEYVLEIVCEKSAIENQVGKNTYHCFNNIDFTPREVFVLKYYLQGKSSKEIASIASISAKAVEFHIANIKNKLNCYKRSDIYQAALSNGFISLIFT